MAFVRPSRTPADAQTDHGIRWAWSRPWLSRMSVRNAMVTIATAVALAPALALSPAAAVPVYGPFPEGDFRIRLGSGPDATTDRCLTATETRAPLMRTCGAEGIKDRQVWRTTGESPGKIVSAWGISQGWLNACMVKDPHSNGIRYDGCFWTPSNQWTWNAKQHTIRRDAGVDSAEHLYLVAAGGFPVLRPAKDPYQYDWEHLSDDQRTWTIEPVS